MRLDWSHLIGLGRDLPDGVTAINADSNTGDKIAR
jgi:hypothetical protein